MSVKSRLYTVSFIEGATVMIAELCGAKLLSPFFGSSLNVWSAVMAITLAGLASGYFIGGVLSKKNNTQNNTQSNLFYVLLLAVCFLSSMPFLTPLFLNFAALFSLIPAVVLSVFVLLFPTMLCLGATSPLVISILSSNTNTSGQTSGTIYAVSTVGGIVATFLSGFYFIPQLGITYTIIIFSILLALVSLFVLVKKKSNYTLYICLLLVGISIYGFTTLSRNKFTIYKADGILGKIEIRDEPSANDTLKMIRKLLVNNIIQAEIDLQTKQTPTEYMRLVEKNSDFYPKGKALVIGLGGGVFANMFVKNNYEVTAVEYDERVIELSKRFFYLNHSVKTICEDARYFINHSKQKYNVVLFDVFKAEEQPSHILTKESLVKLKTMIDSNSVCIINTYGYLSGKLGLGNQCLLATLKDAGFKIKICTFSENEDYRNLLIVASLKPIMHKLYNEMPAFSIFDNTPINTDNKPLLEFLNASASQKFRSLYFDNYINHNY